MSNIRTVRNVAIIGLIALAIFVIPGGGRAADTFEAALLAAFAFGIGYMGLRLYREHRVAVHGLGDRHRALLFGALAIAVFAVAARARMWQTGVGELGWFVLIILVVYALLDVYRRWRAY